MPLPIEPPVGPVPVPAAPAHETMDSMLTRVLEIIPDVQPGHALSMLELHVDVNRAKAVDQVLHALFEDPTYPKIDRKGKRKRSLSEPTESSSAAQKIKIDFANKDRENEGGPLYVDYAMVSPFASLYQIFFKKRE